MPGLLLTVVVVASHFVMSGRRVVGTSFVTIERNSTRRQRKVEPDNREQAKAATCCRAGTKTH